MADCESVILCVHDWWIQVCKCKNWNQTVNLCLIDHSAVDMLVKPWTPGAQVRDWRAAAPDVCVCMCVSAAVINVGAVWGMGRAVCAEWCGQGRLAADSTLMTERVMTEPQTAGRGRSIYSPRWRDGREGRDAAQKKQGSAISIMFSLCVLACLRACLAPRLAVAVSPRRTLKTQRIDNY